MRNNVVDGIEATYKTRIETAIKSEALKDLTVTQAVVCALGVSPPEVKARPGWSLETWEADGTNLGCHVRHVRRVIAETTDPYSATRPKEQRSDAKLTLELDRIASDESSFGDDYGLRGVDSNRALGHMSASDLAASTDKETDAATDTQRVETKKALGDVLLDGVEAVFSADGAGGLWVQTRDTNGKDLSVEEEITPTTAEGLDRYKTSFDDLDYAQLLTVAVYYEED